MKCAIRAIVKDAVAGVWGLLLSQSLLMIPLRAQNTSPVPGPVEAKFNEAVDLLRDNIGPGAAAALQTYRYAIQPIDYNSNAQIVAILQGMKNRAQLDSYTEEAASAQILADLIDIRTKANRSDATVGDRQRKTNAEEAFKRFVDLGGEDANRAYTAYLQSGYAGETTHNVARGGVGEAARRAVHTLGSNARNEYISLLIQQAKTGSRPAPITGSAMKAARNARERYEIMVQVIRDGIGPAAAAYLQAMRYAREPIDAFTDESGNILYEGDKEFVFNAKARFETPNDPTNRKTQPPGEISGDVDQISTAVIPPLVAVFGTQMGADLQEINAGHINGKAGYDQRRWEDAKQALDLLIKAGGDEDDDVKEANECFAKTGTYGDAVRRGWTFAEEERVNGMTLTLQVMRSGNEIVRALIAEEQLAINSQHH